MSTTAKSEDQVPYVVNVSKTSTDEEDAVIAHAFRILESRFRSQERTTTLSDPTTVKQFCCMCMQGLEHEEFMVMFLNTQNQLIDHEVMFRGTLTQTSVYPREVVKAALKLNASAVMFCHNHPSGSVDPSKADLSLTQTLKAALALVEVRVLDHLVVSGPRATSMAETGMM